MDKKWTIEDGIVCPECGGAIVYHRRDDGDTYVRIEPDGKDFEVTREKSYGYTQWECVENEEHELPDEMRTYLDDNILEDIEEAV